MTRRARKAVLSLLLAGAALLAIVAVGPGLLGQLNPFGTETRDRSTPALLQSMQKLHEYRAARASLQQVVDIERDAKHLPSFVAGERIVLVAAGDVDASIDFRRLGPRSLRVSEDRKEVVITLPSARLAPARLDLERTRVIDHDRGLVDRTGDLLGSGGADEERELLLLAQQKLDAAARTDPDLLRNAERNTARMLRRLAGGLGFERVTVRYERRSTV